MKNIAIVIRGILFLGMLFISSYSLSAQCKYYSGFVRAGDSLYPRNKKDEAIKLYILALVDCPDSTEPIYKRIRQLTRSLSKAQREAALLEGELSKFLVLAAEKQDSIEMFDSVCVMRRDSIQMLKDLLGESDLELEKTKERLYFVWDSAASGDRIACLARTKRKLFVPRKYFFTNNNGVPIIRLKQWDWASPFQADGYARVRAKRITYLLDTLGQPTPLPKDWKSNPRNSKSLDLSAKDLHRLPYRLRKRTNTEVFLADQNSIARIPHWIVGYSGLRVLRMANNRIRSIRQIINNRALKYIDLEGNRIRTIPSEIANLGRVQRLNLCRNEIKMVPQGLFQLANLRHLKLGFNDIRKLGDGVSRLTRLEVLDLEYNSLKRLPDSLAYNISLKELDLSGNRLNLFKEKSKDLEILSRLSNLEELRLTEVKGTESEAGRRRLRDQFQKMLPNCKVVFN